MTKNDFVIIRDTNMFQLLSRRESGWRAGGIESRVFYLYVIHALYDRAK